MRTKTLLIGAAALAAGILSSQAQNVYSQNIVGYAQVIIPANQFTLVCNPFDNGTNDIYSIDSGMPNKSVIETWNGTSFVPANKTGTTWSPDLSVPPGVGFFVECKSAFTNTFVGQVGLGGALSNTNSLPTGFSLVGSTIPFSGTITDAGPNTINIGPSLPNKSVIETWTGTNFAPANLTGTTWTPVLTVGVAQGFFVEPKSAASWSQSLTNN
jgi:hypothetical protein